MSNVGENSKRIAKNTLLLYFRMLFMMVISLYTSRVILSVLDIEDYGIYNVVAGVVAMFGFLNSAMTVGTQRYLTFELGKEDYCQLQKVFSTSILIHFFISVLIIIFAETIGLWFLYEKMIFPTNRIDATLWVYQSSVLSLVVMVLSVPYNAMIVAHERMNVYAYISVLEVIAKLLIVYLLQVGNLDKLKLYAVLMFLVQLCIRFVYGFYCTHHFREARYMWFWDSKLFKNMLGFSGWNLWGNCAAMFFTQGLNILLNIFFGPVVNAARGVAVQVQGAVAQFSSNFQIALNPQITKSYAKKDFVYMHDLIFKSSKFTFFLLLFLSLPIMIRTEFILIFWLNIVPDYSIAFLRLILCVTIIDAVANPLMISASATGNVKLYQSVIGGVLLLILPISYLVLKLGGNPASVFVVHLCVCVIAFIIRLFIIRSMIHLSLRDYCQQVILRCLLVLLISIILPLVLNVLLNDTILSFFIIYLACVFSILFSVYYIGLTVSERIFLKKRISAFLLYHKDVWKSFDRKYGLKK